MTNLDLQNLLKFVEFTNLYSLVLRKTILNKDGSAENNSQHSFQMALVSWYINNVKGLKLDNQKLIMYSLVHELVETYSGTHPVYERNSVIQKQIELDEKDAFKKIKSDFKEFGEMIKTIEDYNSMQDKESKFIYALDKLIPIINIELNNNDYYLKNKLTLEDMIKVKEEKIKTDPVIYEYFELLKNYLAETANFFWPNNQTRDYSNKYYKFTN